MLAGADSNEVKAFVQNRLAQLQNKLGEKYAVNYLLFGSKVRQKKEADFKDRETDLDELLKETESNYANQNIGALVVLTDGKYNRGSNPLYRSEKSSFPLWLIGSGDTTIFKDYWIQKINHNEVVYAGNDFPIEVQINAVKCAGQKATVTLLEGKKIIQSRELVITQDQFSTINNFTVTAQNPGLKKYTVTVTSEGEEKNKINNSRTFVIEVINSQQKIVFLAHAPHPDVAAIREAISSNSAFQLDYYALPSQPVNLKGANLVILHGYNTFYLPIINSCRSEGIPYWVIQPSVFDGLSGLKVNTNLQRFNDTEPFLNPSFGLFTLSDELRRFVAEMPAVKTPFGRYDVSLGTQSLLYQKTGSVETESPLFCFTEEGGLKSAVFAGDGLWQWRMKDYVQHGSTTLFKELIGKTIQYLSVKNDKSFFRVQAPRIISENENVQLGAEVYNKSYESVIESDVTLALTNSEGKTFNYAFSKLKKSYQLDLGQLSPGEYTYKATTKYNNEVFVKQGAFAVSEVLSEKIGLTADHMVLRQMAQRSGGRFFKLEQSSELELSLQNNPSIKPITYTESATMPLLDLKIIFWLILILLSAEWYVRKRFLTI